MIKMTITNTSIKGYKENLVIDNLTLEHKLTKLLNFNYRESGDLNTLGELLEILIFEGMETVLKQIG